MWGLRAAHLNQERILVTGGLDGSRRDEVLKCQCDILFVYRCLSTMWRKQLGRKSGNLKRGDISMPSLKSVALVNLNPVKKGNKIIIIAKDLLCTDYNW